MLTDRLARVTQVLAGDKDVGHLLPIPEHTMQLFDECRGPYSSALPLTLRLMLTH